MLEFLFFVLEKRYLSIIATTMNSCHLSFFLLSDILSHIVDNHALYQSQQDEEKGS